MDFEEYWNSLASDPTDSEMAVMQCRFAAENAWYAAMNIEREACAVVCDDAAEQYGQDGGHVADHCGITIRLRSNKI